MKPSIVPKPEISVVIPAYNASCTLGRALESVLSQTYPAKEVIVVDDGSSDNLDPLKARFSSHVRWIHQLNQGAAAARNSGVLNSTGSHVAFLDADDYWEPEKLNLQAAVFMENANVRLCCSAFFEEIPGSVKKNATRHIGSSPQFDLPLRMNGPSAFDTACCVTTSTVVVERSALGTEPFHLGFEPAEDRELWVRLVSNWPIYFLRQPTATLVLVPGSLSRTRIDRDCGNMLRVVEKSSDLLGKKGQQQWKARIYRRWAAEYLGNGDPKSALVPAWKRLSIEPWSAQAWWILTKAILSKRKP